MKSKLLLSLLVLLGIGFDAPAQLLWSSYNSAGARVSASAASYDSGAGSYTFTIPANTAYTFITTDFVPVTLAASQTKTVAFTMNASGGFGPAGTPIQNQRFIAYGLFNYGATPPGASGSFTDDLGLWTSAYQQTSAINPEVFGGTSTAANLLAHQSSRQLGAGVGPAAGAIGQFVNGSTTNVTFRVVENAGGTASIGTGTTTATAGAWYADTATGGTTFNRTVFSGSATTPNGATTFNEFGFLFNNTTSSPVTLVLGSFTGLTPIFTTQPPANTVATVGGNVTLTAVAPTATAFQWQKSTDGGATFSNVSGATAASLSLTNVQTGDGAIYNVVATTPAETVASANATLTVFTANPNDPPVFVAYKTSQVASGSTPTSATTATIAAPGAGWTYSAAAQVAGTTWNQIQRPNPLIGSGTLNGTVGTFVCNSANNIGLTSATGAATNVKLTMHMLINDLEAGSSTRIEPNTGVGGATVLGPAGLMGNAWRIFRAGNTSTATISGLTARAHYLLYVYGSTTTATQGCRFTLHSDNAASDDLASKSTVGGNSGNIFSTDGSTYSLTAAGTTWQQFHAVANGSGNIVITSGFNPSNGGQFYNGLQLVPYPLPTITTQPPASAMGTTNGSVALSVAATTPVGTLTYQWQKSTDNGVTFHNIDPYGGNATAGTATLLLSNLQNSDAAIYRVLVSNAGGTVLSGNCTLTVQTGTTAPSIVTHPASQTVLVGATASFSVVASGTSPFTYQWQKSTDGGATFPINVGTNSDTYSIASAALTDPGQYRVVVTNSAGNATSNAATLTVNEPPSITTQPVGAIVAAGASHTLSVVATGTPAPTYQWRRNGTNISGATASSYSITNASGANAGSYTVVVTNAAGSVTSTGAYVGVLSSMAVTALTPSNGATGLNRDVLLSVTFDQPVSVGTTGRIRVYDTANPGTPVDTIDMSTAITVTQFATPYRYMAKTIGGTNFNYMPVLVSGNTATIALHSSTVMGYNKTYYVNIEPGVLLDATGATYGGISDSTTWSFGTKSAGPAAGATSITVAADGSGDFNTVQGAVDFVPFSPANTIPRTITIANGTYTEIVRLRSGQNLVTMQGQSRAGTVIQYLTNNNTLISGAGSIGQRSVFGADPNDFTIQTLTIRNSTPQFGSQAEAFWVGNNALRMTIYNLNILSYQDTFMNNGGQAFVTDCYIEGDVDFIWGSGRTFIQNSELKMMLSGGFYVQSRNSQTFPGFFFSNCQLTAGAGVTANSSWLARIDPNPSGGYPYSQVVWMNCRMGPHIIAAGWQLNNATTAPNIKYWEYLSYDLAGTTPINIASRPTYNNNPTGVGGSTVLNNQQIDAATAAFFSDAVNAIGWAPRPVIGAHPASITATVNQSAGFSVAATSPLAQTYQWKKDGVDIPAATSASYVIPSVTAGSAGTYTVVVTNPAGSTTSNGAVLTVQSIIDAWRVQHFGSAGHPNAANTADPDGDTIQNSMEFAFGMDPNVNGSASVAWSGSTLTTHGLPIAYVETTPTAVNYQAIFTRRLDWVAAGLNYTVQFSADLITWENSQATPTVIASDSTHEAVSVPYLLFVNHRKARFFRVEVTVP